MEKGLIIFVRNTEKGKVKTRLAKSVGEDEALRVYKFLLQHTRDTTYPVNCNHFVFYSSYVHVSDMFDDDYFSKHLQEGNDLGERMERAFQKVFELGCKKVCIIGSDCYDLEPGIIEEAFERLADNEVVIGPSTDGGYYLLGLKQLQENILKNIDWGTSTVFENTIAAVDKAGLPYYKLPSLNDIDTIEDLEETNILAKLQEGQKH